MAERNKRDWFATGESDDEEQGYDSENAEESRGRSISGRSVKRQRLERADAGDKDDGDSQNSDDALDEEVEQSFLAKEKDSQTRDGEKIVDAKSKLSTPSLERAKAQRRLAKAEAKVSKTGVVYLSRIPPFMKPHTLKHLLQPFAPSGLDRIFLTPEDPKTHKSRVKSGGNKKKSFMDGWVEFVSKREAKLAAETLNGKNIGGKKGNYYYDDVWNLKYLKGFKWRHLTEQIANENAERDARLRAEGARERREVREFLRNVERSKMIGGMEKKKREKTSLGDAKAGIDRRKDTMEFRQSAVVSKAKNAGPDGAPNIDTQRVLSKIF